MRRAILLLLALLLAPGALDAGEEKEKNPFDGWTEKQFQRHTNRAKRLISLKSKLWITSWVKLVRWCGTCHGSGQVTVLRGTPPNTYVTTMTCPGCGGRRLTVSTDCFLKLHWDYKSPTFRNDLGKRRTVIHNLRAAHSDPFSIIRIGGWTNKKIKVLGNTATVTYTIRVRNAPTKQTLRWIEVDGDWWIYDETADYGFKVWGYPEDHSNDEDEIEDGAPDPALLEPALVFSIEEPEIRHLEEDAYRVLGALKNTTESRRFMHVIVEVTLWKGEDLVEAATCNSGGCAIKPGEIVTYSGVIYYPRFPKYDRIETRIVSFDILKD